MKCGRSLPALGLLRAQYDDFGLITIYHMTFVCFTKGEFSMGHYYDDKRLP